MAETNVSQPDPRWNEGKMNPSSRLWFQRNARLIESSRFTSDCGSGDGNRVDYTIDGNRVDYVIDLSIFH